jgi:hypothetical protein
MRARIIIAGITACTVMMLGVMWQRRAVAYTGCAGDQTNSTVVAEYIFSEGSGTNALNTGTDGDAGNLALTNGAVFSTDVPPPNGGCGWSIRLPYTNIASVAPGLVGAVGYHPLESATQFTVMAWVKRESPSATNNTAAVIVSDTSTLTATNTTTGFEFGFGSSGALLLRVNGEDFSSSYGQISPTNGVWHHVAAVYDGTRPATNNLTMHVQLYVDGVQQNWGGELTATNRVVGMTTNRLNVGRSSASPVNASRKFAGKIDNLRILRGFAPAAVGRFNTNNIIRCYMNPIDDIEPPQITCPSDVVAEMPACSGTLSNVNLGQPVVTDNCGVASVTNNAPSQYTLGVVAVIWTAADTAGNHSTCTQQVTVVYSSTADSDTDGLTDAEEVYTYQTDPCNPDSDGDGMPDGWEVRYGLDPLDPNDASGDLDGDGVSNLDEYRLGRNPADPIDLTVFTPME